MTRSRRPVPPDPFRQDDGTLTDDEIVSRLQTHSEIYYGPELTWNILGVEVLLYHPLGDATWEPPPAEPPVGGVVNTGPSPVGSHQSAVALLCPRRYAYTYGVDAALPDVHTARLDLLVELSDETILAVDHKTIAQSPTQGKARQYNHDMQGTGLRWLLKKTFPGRKVGLMYNFIGTGKAPEFARFGPANLPPNPALVDSYEDTLMTAREVVRRHRGAETPRDWTPTPTSCHVGPNGGCPFRDRCGVGL